ncbi:MAG: cell division protein SepF [Clostridiales Family XIII bacterium]|jgi:cell division inhibitor SepF|nr:cell division protein SepF [Clostridiales Family XIII bacterium]
MAGFFTKIRTLVGMEDEDYMEDEAEEELVQEKENSRVSRLGLEDERFAVSRERMRDAGRSRMTSSFASGVSAERENVISMQDKTLKAITSQFKIVVIEPRSFDECPKLVDSLKSRKPVIINLEKMETDMARKIFDFLSGATYALNGNVQKIANNIFVFLPENVDVSTNTSHKGMTFGSEDGNPWKL